jgi:creatinine amidohydrolase/Fe(II)-dependent formamide hydrolase-like protein
LPVGSVEDHGAHLPTVSPRLYPYAACVDIITRRFTAEV